MRPCFTQSLRGFTRVRLAGYELELVTSSKKAMAACFNLAAAQQRRRRADKQRARRAREQESERARDEAARGRGEVARQATGDD